jgi:thiamine biosynthesis lipoprotein
VTREAAPRVTREGALLVARFTAMASPCEVLLETHGDATAIAAGEAALAAAAAEAMRIEQKYSRYRSDSVMHAIQQAAGAEVEMDEETSALLDFAAQAHEASDGRFDITTGALRRCWTFDGRDITPDTDAIREACASVGWSRVKWHRPRLTLPAGMELDFGGIGKEYAVDRVAAVVAALLDSPCLVNFGGDLFASGPRRDGVPWSVGIEDPEAPGRMVTQELELTRGGVATSGDARRYVMVEGRRLGHVLDSRTGWPVSDAPRSVTVVAATCLEAGTLATIALLHGASARGFLQAQGVTFTLRE